MKRALPAALVPASRSSLWRFIHPYSMCNADLGLVDGRTAGSIDSEVGGAGAESASISVTEFGPAAERFCGQSFVLAESRP